MKVMCVVKSELIFKLVVGLLSYFPEYPGA